MSSSLQDSQDQQRIRARKSIGAIPLAAASSNAFDADKENSLPDMNQTSELVFQFGASKMAADNKKSRSKSLGPGGLDALQASTGNRRKTVASSIPRSILKPTVPLSPLREIPSRRQSPINKNYASPTRSSAQKDVRAATISEAFARDNDTISGTDSGSMPSAGDDHTFTITRPRETEEEAERRRAEKERIMKQREDRRKSMVNRRVSFAPEATLHTWDLVEYPQDPTTSSASTTSRRDSGGSTDSTESLTPLKEVETQVEGTPDSEQRRKRRRRSSGIPPMNFNDPDVLSSSPFGDHPVMEDDEEEDENDDGDDGSMSMDLTGAPNMDAQVDPNIENALKQAADQAGTKEIEYDENGDVSMSIDGDSPSAAFRPWVQQSLGAGSPHPRPNNQAAKEKEASTVPYPDLRNFQDQAPGSPATDADGDEMSMDITKAIGGILPQQQAKRRQSVMNRRRSMAQSETGEGTMAMDFTMALGGIKAPPPDNTAQSQIDENEEMSMEFTSVFGADLSKMRQQPVPSAHESEDDAGDGDMEMTTAFGGILPRAHDHSHANTRSPEAIAKLPSRRRSSLGKRLSFASASGSPVMNDRRRSGHDSPSPTRKSPSTPSRVPSTPQKQVTPQQPLKPSTPSKTPPSANVSMRFTSPKKLFQHEAKAAKSPFDASNKLFKKSADGKQTPNIVLSHREQPLRRLSDGALPSPSAGSPRVTALLDRRASIGEQADTFTPQIHDSSGVRFEDPRRIEAEVNRDRDEEIRRESGLYILEQESENHPDQENATQTLRDMMQTMTPKKQPSRVAGRKSLHVGAAKGILGKRPAELDSDDEPSPDTVRGREASPVKKIRLQAPPSKTETTGRIGKRTLKEISGNPATPTLTSPSKPRTASTPKDQGRFKDAEALPSAQKPIRTFGENVGDEPNEPEENIQLQDFLNMTSIRFMELNTTKRRHTIAPSKGEGVSVDDFHNKSKDQQFEDSVVAGACTIPMLELFQHSCRELRKYISEGRDIVKEIEKDTYEENPQVFRDYLSASPATRSSMDNQFKNIKTHARHLSKGMWYEWRMKLLEGLKHSLDGTDADMKNDAMVVEKLEHHVHKHLPQMLTEKEKLEAEHSSLQARASEFNQSDPQELSEARNRLTDLTAEIDKKRRLLEDRQRELQQFSEHVDHAQQRKTATQKNIKEAQRQREAFRGWSMQEVQRLRGEVTSIEATTGWKVNSASGSFLTMVYRSQIQLYFDVSAFSGTEKKRKSSSANSPISLTYVADEDKLPLTTEKRFFLQMLRAHLQCLPQNQMLAKDLLGLVGQSWSRALAVVDEIRSLDFFAPSRCEIVGDERMVVNTEILLLEARSKLSVSLEVRATIAAGRLSPRLDSASVHCIYGETFKEGKMKEFIESNMGQPGDGSWVRVMSELRKKLAARGKKQ